MLIFNHSCDDTTLATVRSSPQLWRDALFTFLQFLASYNSHPFFRSENLFQQNDVYTCYSCLIVVWCYDCRQNFNMMYCLPDAVRIGNLNKICSLFWTILTFWISPLIYSLRDRELEGWFRKVFFKQTDLTGIQIKVGSFEQHLSCSLFLPLGISKVGSREDKCYLMMSAVTDHRITEWLRWEGTSGGHLVQPPAQAGTPRASWRGPCPDDFWVFPKVETPQPPWASSAGAQSPTL